MTVRLVPLTPEELPFFIERAIYEGMQTLIRSKEHEDIPAAYEAAKHNVTSCFQPAYISKQLVYHIYAEDLKKNVGHIWLEQPYHAGQVSTFVAYILVEAEYRRRGYAKAALLEAEKVTQQLGLNKIELYVFAFNAIAKSLYEGLGYHASQAKAWGKTSDVTRFIMSKILNGESSAA
jgi:ribosomal protein S18 acetylase RimI-like enzyme